MKNTRFFLSEHFPFLVVKFSIYLYKRIFVMFTANCSLMFIIDDIGIGLGIKI